LKKEQIMTPQSTFKASLRVLPAATIGIIKKLRCSTNIRRYTAMWMLAVGLVAALTAGGVWAASVHFKHGSPSFFDNGLTLTAFGDLAGLGNENIVVRLEANANATAVCTNPSGANQPPGQNPAPVTVTGAQAIPASEIKNGTVGFRVTTDSPLSPIPGAPGCPNPNWTETITDMTFTCADVIVEQPAGISVLEASFDLSGPTSGTIGALTATPRSTPCP
jgi:hypothetical protein